MESKYYTKNYYPNTNKGSKYFNDIKAILDKHAFLIHEEYITYKNLKSAHMDPRIRPIWMEKYGPVWQEVKSYMDNYENRKIFKITTVLGDIVELVPGTGFTINGWI